jgi:branched-chain amino acid transport system permease protein
MEKKNKMQQVGLFIVISAAIFFPLLNISPYLVNIAVLMFISILFASAWNFLAYSGQASLGHAAFFGIGAYASTLAARAIGLSPYLSILLGGVVAAFLGILIGITCVRLREWFLAMVTFGFAVIIQIITASVLAPVTGGWDGLSSPRLISTDFPAYPLLEYYSILLIVIICIVCMYLILKSRVGLAFAAIRENELEARAAGVDLVKYKLYAFSISTFMAGLAGGLQTHHFGYITPEIFHAENSFLPVIHSILGGLGTISGPIIGTVILTIIWDGLKGLGLRFELFVVIGLLLILIVIFLPKGLISLPEKIRSIRERITNR